MPEPDFDPSNSGLRIGIELEYPGRRDNDELFVSRGRGTSGLSDIPIPRSDANATYDGTVGLEVVSDVLDLEDAAFWHADIIDHVEAEHVNYQPVGLMSNGNTAGLHLHLSPLTESEARQLYEISQTAWAKVLFCTSIANENGEAAWPVFRGGRHCRMNFSDGDRYACVNRRGGSHYEWRLPEPMMPENLEVVATFLRLFEQDPDHAIQYAQEILDDGDERITSIQRAEATGMDIDEVPTVRREPSPDDPQGFYESVASRWDAPEIYLVEVDGNHYYAFETSFGTFEVDGLEVGNGDVIYADGLDYVSDEEEARVVNQAFNRRNAESSRRTEATEELKKIVKKKKK